MDSKKVTNWFNWDEWNTFVQDVYNNGNDMNSYRRAFYRLLAWECRESNLPAALVGLKELLIAKLYPFDHSTASIDEAYFYKSCVAMNIVRFVNFVTEPYQKGTFAAPIKSIANEIGIPDWIVNMRHNATHNSLPSVEILENARDFLFDWIKINFVDTYKEVPLGGSIIGNIKQVIQEVFVDYINDRFKKVIMEGHNIKKPKSILNASEDNSVELALEQFRNETLEIILQNGFLIPNVEQLESIGIVVEEFLDDNKILMPKPIIKVWKEFLLICNEKNLMGLVFENMISAYKLENDSSTTNPNPLRNKLLLCWMLSLIDSNTLKTDKIKQLQLEFEFNPKKLLSDILTVTPNQYTLNFLKQSKKMNWIKKSLSEDSINKLIALVSIADAEEMMDDDQVAQVSEEEEKAELVDANGHIKFDDAQNNGFYGLFNLSMDNWSSERGVEIQKTNRSASNWILIDDVNWNHENVKLGLIPGQNYQELNFEIGVEEDDRDQNKSAKASQDHNLSINEAALKGITSSKKLKLDTGFSISELSEFHDDSLRRIRQELVKSYWGCASIVN